VRQPIALFKTVWKTGEDASSQGLSHFARCDFRMKEADTEFIEKFVVESTQSHRGVYDEREFWCTGRYYMATMKLHGNLKTRLPIMYLLMRSGNIGIWQHVI
jgi:hypothetical protein